MLSCIYGIQISYFIFKIFTALNGNTVLKNDDLITPIIYIPISILFIKGNVFVPRGCSLYTESKATRLNV